MCIRDRLEFAKGKILKKQINLTFENVFDIPLNEIKNIISNQSNNYSEEIKCLSLIHI